MKKKQVKLVVSLIVAFLCLLMLLSTQSYANNTNNIDSWITQGNSFINEGSKGTAIDVADIKNTVLPIGQALVAIATVVLVVVTIIMGIKYMTCGSPDQKAKLKTQLIGLVVSTVVIFGAQTIWALIYNFMIGITK